MHSVVEQFKETYGGLDAQSLGLLAELYTDDVLFQDPFRRLEGLGALTRYFAELYAHVEACAFTFDAEVVQSQQAVLLWTMSLRHPRLNGGQPVVVPGSTHVRFRHKIHFHRDYFDAGAMLYEHLPLIGMIVRFVKERV